MTDTVPVVAEPLSAGQYQLWLAEELRRRDTGELDATYTTAEVLAVDDVNPAALHAALRTLPERHEVLRTTFELRDGVPHQLVHDLAPTPVERHLLDQGDNHLAEFERLLAAAVRRPFPLDEAPLCRALLATAGRTTYLALVLHHIAADGWSVELLMRDLADLYRAAAGGQPAPMPPARTFREYARDHRRRLELGALADSATYWRSTLQDAPERTAVPGLGPHRPEPGTTGGAQLLVPLPAKQHTTVCEAAARLRTTPLMFYLAAHTLALARLVRRHDVVTGTPSVNRDDEDYLDVVGPFAAVLPIRTQLPRRITPAALVGRVTTAVFEATEHQEFPLVDIAAVIGHGTSRTGMPLYQTAVMQREWREPDTTFAGLPARRLWVSTGTAKYDLLVTFPTAEQDARIVIEYDLSRYDEHMAASIGRALSRALDEVLGDAEIDVIGEPPPDTGEQPVHERLAEIARHAPDHPAVVAGRAWCSYAELDHMADQVGAGLQRSGVRPGDLVGIRLPRGIGFVTAALGVLKVGAAYVPTDPGWPRSRVRQVLAATTLTICQDDLADPDDALDTTLARLRSLGADARMEPVASRPRQPCCVLYTSGSTGAPKGVLIEHRSVRRLAAPDQPFAFRPADRVPHHANLAFDLTTLEVWGTLLAGATVLASLPENPGPADRAADLDDATAAIVITGLFTELVVHPDCRTALRSLRMLAVGGSAIAPGTTRSILRPERIQLNVYGPTECTTLSTAGPLAARTDRHTVPIGVPIAGTRGYVLDENLDPVPDGETGELYLAGAGVADGYFGDPRQTAQRFLPDPAVPGERMYATGDQVRRLPDGAIDFIGRNDSQIKYRGFRVEPAEIETALQTHAEVHAAYAGLNAAGQLVAAVRADPGTDPGDLRRRLQAVLPAFMVPSHIAVTDQVPLTANGKVDIAGLLASVGPDTRPAAAGDVAGTTLNWVIELWSSVLGVVAVADTHFFEAGGDSLHVLQLLTECRNEFGVDLRPAVLFDHSTPRDFAALLAERTSRPEEGK